MNCEDDLVDYGLDDKNNRDVQIQSEYLCKSNYKQFPSINLEIELYLTLKTLINRRGCMQTRTPRF